MESKGCVSVARGGFGSPRTWPIERPASRASSHPTLFSPSRSTSSRKGRPSRKMGKRIKDRAVLQGFDSAGTLVFEESIELRDYWDETHAVIDKASFRAKRSIRRLVGRLYGAAGNQLQTFESRY